jgi:hypothetical protein
MMNAVLVASTRTAEIFLLEERFVVTRIRAGAAQSPADASENLVRTVEACGKMPRPLLVDISRSLPLEPEARHFYTGSILAQSFLALGLLVEASPLGRMMGNVYLRIARPGIPTRLFAEEEPALAWLRTFVA